MQQVRVDISSARLLETCLRLVEAAQGHGRPPQLGVGGDQVRIEAKALARFLNGLFILPDSRICESQIAQWCCVAPVGLAPQLMRFDLLVQFLGYDQVVQRTDIESLA